MFYRNPAALLDFTVPLKCHSNATLPIDRYQILHVILKVNEISVRRRDYGVLADWISMGYLTWENIANAVGASSMS